MIKKKKISPVARGFIAWQVTKKPKRLFLKCSQNFKQKSKLSDSASDSLPVKIIG